MPAIDGVNPRGTNTSYAQIKKPRRRWRLFLLFLLILMLASSWATAKLLSKTNQIFTNRQNPLVRLGKLFLGDDKKLIGEDKGAINVLLLGMGGEGHEGPLLTDTIIVASIDTKTNEALMVSVPRDFGVTLEGYGFNRINAAYAYAEAKSGTGGEAAIAAVEKITGFEIPYFAAVDFEGFVKAINYVGGLDITIDRTFTDATFPNSQYGYLQPVTFTKGEEHMDGTRALQFTRSRHGNNSEGSDFARSERQKKIITAFVGKIIKLNLTDIKTVNNLFSVFTSHFRTNLEPYELKRLGDLAKSIKSEAVYPLSLEPGTLICDTTLEQPTGRMIPKPQDNTVEGADVGETELIPEVTRMYVIQPCSGKTLTDIHDYLKNAFLTAKLQNEHAIVEIQNSTGKAQALDKLSELNSVLGNVKITTFASKTPYERTILYDNSGGKFPNTADYLKNSFDFTLADIPYSNSNADFVIILGKDAL